MALSLEHPPYDCCHVHSVFTKLLALSMPGGVCYRDGEIFSLTVLTWLRDMNLCTPFLNNKIAASHSAAAAAKSLQSCLTLCDPTDGSPPGSPVPGILQARTRVGYHFLLQCMKVKSESEVAQSCPTPSDPMDCSPPGPSIHGIFQARVLEWGAIAFSDDM